MEDSKLEHLIKIGLAKLDQTCSIIKEKEDRKTHVLNTSITLCGSYFTASVALGAAVYSKNASGDIGSYFISLVCIVSVCFFLLIIMLITQYVDAYFGKIGAIEQLNLLNRMFCSIQYQLIEGDVPGKLEDLLNKNTEYYKFVGKNNSTPLSNEKLGETEKRGFNRSVGFVVGGMAIISGCVSGLAPVFFLYQKSWMYAAPLSLVILIVVIIIYLKLKSKHHLFMDEITKKSNQSA